MSVRRASTQVAGVLTALALAACTAASAPSAVSASSAPTAPTAPTAVPAVSPRSAGPDCGRPESSFDPLPALPVPGHMPAGSTMERIVARGRLIVATSGDKPMLGVRDPGSGELTGVDIDLSRQIGLALFGRPDTVEFRTISFAQREPMLRSGQVDLVAHSMVMTCDRWQREAFSTEYFRDGQRIMVRADSAVREVEDLVGQRVCVARGTTTIDNLARYPGLVVVPVDDAALCQVLFERDEVDAVTSNDVILRGYAASDPSARIVGRDLSSDPRGLAFRPGEVDLVRFVNAVLARLREDGSLAAILRRHVPGVDLAHVLRPAVYGRQP